MSGIMTPLKIDKLAMPKLNLQQREAHPLLNRMCSSFSWLRWQLARKNKGRAAIYLWKVSAALLTDARSARSISRKIAFFPVSFSRSAIAASALLLLRDAMYTFAFLGNNAWSKQCHEGRHMHRRSLKPKLTFTVSFPMPVFPPVTIITLPLRSGMSAGTYLGFGINHAWSQTWPNFQNMDSVMSTAAKNINHG